jgi:proline dehydrogenase
MFDNLKVAFQDKSDLDLNRSYFLFLAISKPIISKILISFLKIAMSFRLPVSSIIEATVYKHFCGGIDINKSQKTIDNLWKSKIGTILDYSAEGKETENDYNLVMHQVLESINKAKDTNKIPFTVFKPTGLTKFALLEKMSLNSTLSSNEKKEKKLFISRIETICKKASENKVPVFIDAEESWIQDPVDQIAFEMMLKFNKNKAYIFNTIQLYRTDRYKYLKQLIKAGKNKGIYIGVKLVRGAYHEQEIQRALEKNLTCPVHTLKENTDKDYDDALELCMKNINLVSVCAGTHNEKSSKKLISLIKNYNIRKDDDRIFFSQLLGMSDNISYNTSKAGFNVAKYVPYGPVKDVIPYLIRRAEENKSIAGQMGRELQNIVTEKKRRKSIKSKKYFNH